MIKKHGNRQIEFKHYFEISKDIPCENYDVNIWVFTPSNLNKDNYNVDDFFSDFTSYTRYNAPNLTLEVLSNFSDPINPITRIANTKHNIENLDVVEYELKSLLNIFKMSCNRTISTLKAMKKFSSYESQRNLQVQLERIRVIQSKLFELSEMAPPEYHSIYDLAIEGFSLRIEKNQQIWYKTFSESEDVLLKEIEFQRKYRAKLGFKSIITEDKKNNSETIYREHIIKKWAQSILYINLESSKTQKGIGHIFLGSAAALAMLITGIITIILAKVWGSDSLYWFIAAMLLYSLKDRIKDIFKAIFMKKMNIIFSDRVKSIISPINQKKCGLSKESVTFPKYRDIDSDLQSLRFYLKNDISIKQYQEDIIHYRKHVKISTSKLYKNHTRLVGIMEIMRLDFRKWFHRMDKDVEKCYMPQNGYLIQVKGDREYHFNIILQIEASNQSIFKRYRIVANGRRITTVEKIT